MASTQVFTERALFRSFWDDGLLDLLATGGIAVLFGLGPAFPLVGVALAVLTAGAILLTRFVRDSRNHEEPS